MRPLALLARIALLVAAFVAPLAAVADDDVEEIVVTARRAPQPRREVAGSLSTIEPIDLHDARLTLNLDESLNRVPGVFIQNSGNFAQDARLQIRGFGTRAAFGIRELRVLVDGLPDTYPDGQTQIDEVDLDAIDRIEILRGPAAALYGNASGGVLQLFRGDPTDQPSVRARFTGGSYGLRKYSIRGSAALGRVGVFVHASHLQLDGFRQHSGAETTVAGAKVVIEPIDDTTITTLVDAVDAPKADDAGALTRADANAGPTQASSRNLQFDAGEELQQGRLGWVLNHDRGDNHVSGYAYLLYRDFENRLATQSGGIVTFNRFSPGGGLRYARDLKILGRRNTISSGLDAQYQDDNRRRFDNDNGARGALNLDQRERVTSVGPYVHDSLAITDQIEVSAALRYDRVMYDVDVDYDAGGGDGSGTTHFDAWSPLGSIRYSPLPWLALFFDAGTSFQVPTTTELAVPNESGLDGSLHPQTALTYELGTRLQRGRALTGGLSGFLIDLDDELIAYESEPGKTRYRNAGSSRRMGLEADWQAELLDGLRWTGAFTYIDAQFRDYRTGTDAAKIFDDNHEPGIPPWQIFFELLYTHHSGVFIGLESFLVDGYYVDDANTTKSRRYELLNLRSGWNGRVGHWRVSPFVGLNNLTDAKYDGTVRLNALGSRFFEPAPAFNVFAGIAIGWE